MPKRKRSRRAISTSADVRARNCTDDHVNKKVKIEPASDVEFDPMQSESTKMVLLNANNVTGALLGPEFDAIKPECDVKIENPFRAEMLENSHEVAYISQRKRSRTGEQNMPEKIVVTKTKHRKKKKLTKCNKKQTVDPVEIEVNGGIMTRCRPQIKNHIRHTHTRKKPFKCDYCMSRFTSLSGSSFFRLIFLCHCFD